MKFLEHSVTEEIRADGIAGQSDSTDDPSIDIFSYKSIGNLSELLSKLELEILPLWEEIKESAVVTDISNFATLTAEVAEGYNYMPLVSWINTLEKHINTFELDMIHGTLRKFPEMISNMKKQLA
jgi:hypothetical protein